MFVYVLRLCLREFKLLGFVNVNIIVNEQSWSLNLAHLVFIIPFGMMILSGRSTAW